MALGSFWHWILILAYVAVPVAAVASTRPSNLADRGRLLMWVAIYIVFAVGWVVLDDAIMRLDWAFLILGYLVGLFVLEFVVVRTSAARCQDLRWSRWLALLWLIPLVNLVFIIILLVKPGRQSAASTETP